MKNAIATVLQFLLFLVLFALGSFFYHPFGVRLHGQASDFDADGVLLMLLLYLLILLIEVLAKRLRSAARWSTLAVLLAGIAGWALKFGLITHAK